MKFTGWFLEKDGCERIKEFGSFKELKAYYREHGIPEGCGYGFEYITRDGVTASKRYAESALGGRR